MSTLSPVLCTSIMVSLLALVAIVGGFLSVDVIFSDIQRWKKYAVGTTYLVITFGVMILAFPGGVCE